MKKTGLVNSLSAVVLLAFGFIWLVYLCAGNMLSPEVHNVLSLVVSFLALATYLIKAIGSAKNMPLWLVWLLFIAIAGSIPANIVDLLQACGLTFDWTSFPIVNTIFEISHGITFIILYLLLIYNAWGVTESLIFRLIFTVIGMFLIFCVVAEWIPYLAIMPVPLVSFGG